MTTTLENLIKEIANTFDKIEILNFFNQNPDAMDSAEGISDWIGKKKEDIIEDLDELVEDKVLQREGLGVSALFRYSPPDKIRESISNLLSAKKLYENKIRELQKERDKLEDQFLREILREKSKTKTIIESMKEGVLVLNKNLHLLSINPVARNIFAIKEESVLGRGISDVIEDKENLEKIKWILETDNSQGKFEEDVLFNSNWNETYKASLSFLKEEGENRDLIGYVLVFNDITKEKEMEKLKADFVSMITHDLKNPLNTIILNSTFMLEKFQNDFENSESNFLRMINESGKKILRIIEDFLSVSMIEAGMLKLNIEKVDFGKFLSLMIYAFSSHADDKGLKIKTEISKELPLVCADRFQLERVVDNILSNAIKFTPEGGSIKITAFEKGGMVHTSIADTGIGISKEDLPNLFNKYYRSQGASNIKGTGLGLSIVKSIINAHKGKIILKSEEGKGTIFTFQIPVGKLE